jgi:hypothetical protein
MQHQTWPVMPKEACVHAKQIGSKRGAAVLMRAAGVADNEMTT